MAEGRIQSVQYVLAFAWLSVFLFLGICFLLKPLKTQKQLLLNVALSAGVIAVVLYAVGLIFVYQKTNADPAIAAANFATGQHVQLASGLFLYLMFAVILYQTYYAWFFRSFFYRTYLYLTGISTVLTVVYTVFVTVIFLGPTSFAANDAIGLASFLVVVPLFALQFLYILYLVTYASDMPVFRLYVKGMNWLSDRFVKALRSVRARSFGRNRSARLVQTNLPPPAPAGVAGKTR